uniref:Coiled-coil and C2 domain containing 2B n=1 Tax=Ornithorhynchus anatinus TaxID=9258 RepID=A0A6I8PRH2_ORNAN
MSSDEALKKVKTPKRILLQKISRERKVIKKKLSDEAENTLEQKPVTENEDQNLLKEETQSYITEALRDRVREKLKNAKVMQGEKSPKEALSNTDTYQRDKNEAIADKGLLFFITNGDGCSEYEASNQTIDWRSVKTSDHKHTSVDNSCRTFDDEEDQRILEEVFSQDLLEIKAADYEDDDLQSKKQQERIFMPTSSPVAHQRKLPENTIPRILEDEGFYIQRRPEICKKICNKMENRLVKQEEGKCWFDESGEIISLPSPLKQSWNFRKTVAAETLNPGIMTTFKQAIPTDLESRIRSKAEFQRELCQLDLNISSLRFSHHPLFNQELVLCSRLLQLFECFQLRRQQNTSHLLYEKLQALTNTMKIGKHNLETSQLSKKSQQDYHCQISDTKHLYDLEQKKDSSLIHSMLKVWKQIKSLRLQQGFSSTSIKLQFQKVTVNKDECAKEALTKVSETKMRPKGEGDKNLIESEQFLDVWEKEEGLSYLTSEIDEKGIESLKQPTLIPQLSMNAEVTSLSRCPMHERRRRDKVQKLKYFIRIFYNDKQVSCTSVSPLQLDFKVVFQQIFNIQLINWPGTIRLEIYEMKKRSCLLAKIYLPLPNKAALKSSDSLEEAEFSCDKLVTPAYGEVGSNVPFHLGEPETEELCLLTSGKLSYSLAWAVNANGIPPTPVPPSFTSACCSVLKNAEGREVPGIQWLANPQKLIEWADEVRIDPNDPDYSELMEFIMCARQKGQTSPRYFRLEQLEEEFHFAAEDEIAKSKRFQLIQLRNSGQLDHLQLQQIPLYDREIPDLIFQEYESQLEKDLPVTDANSIISHRSHSSNLMRKMRTLVMKKVMKVSSKFNLSDMVTDYEEIVSASQLKEAICKLVRRRRNLKPQRKERITVAAQTISDGDIKILIRISRGYNIPSRKSTVSRNLEVPGYLLSSVSWIRHKESVTTNEFSSEVNVRPFVEVSFQHTVYQTDTVDGSHPCWNEELILDFSSPGHDYSISGLAKIKDNIVINIFDEVVIEKHEDNCLKGCRGHSYTQKHWLGSVTIPFSALLQQSKINGTFQVDIPPVLLGYTWSQTYLSPTEDCSGQNLKECTFLTIFATLEPQISSAVSDSESDKLADQIKETLLQRAHVFKKTCKALFPNRRIVTVVFNDEGRYILAPRYIRALNPPQPLLDVFLNDLNATLALLARFVSLIPCTADPSEGNGSLEIWMTSEHCISMAIGNKEEHAVLLCNYFLYLKKKAWVLLGTSVLEGQVAYVITQESDEYLLWNPLTGRCYRQFDSFCPLQSADCLIDEENVWFNIQPNSTPMAITFDHSKEGLWKQFLPSNFQWTKSTIQPKEILYSTTNQSMVEDLKNRIERDLKLKLMEWRPKQPTRWHRQCTAILRRILPKMELGPGNIVSKGEENELERLLQHYWVSGFPMHLPFTDLQTLTDAVYQTGVHSSELPQTEFALAVHIHPYPNNVLSVWIYLASLVRNQ